MQIGESQLTDVLKLSGAVDMQDLELLHGALLERLGRDSDLTLDLADVDDCCTAAFQLLYSARKSAERLHRTFSVAGVSQPLVELSAALGLSLEELTGHRSGDEPSQTSVEAGGGEASGL